MAATTVNIVATDTYANLKTGEPYSSDHYGQFVFASDFDLVYRVNNAGAMVGLFKMPTSVQLDVTGASVIIASLPETPTHIAVYVDGSRFFQGTAASTEVQTFYIPTGGGQINFPVALDDESVFVEFLP